MKRFHILYYSYTGNSAFLAGKLAGIIGASIQEIKPRMNHVGLQFFFTLIGWSPGFRMDESAIAEADEIILIGPIWGGKLIAPLRTALDKAVSAGKKVHLSSCCGSSDHKKEDKWGYARVLREAGERGGDLLKTATAFPVSLVYASDKDWTEEDLQQLRWSDDNYGHRLEERLRSFASEVCAAEQPVG